jgi:uncharacterized FAD-dependent dehydrogenase
MRIAIVGAGPAGLFTAFGIGPSHEVHVFEQGEPLERRVCDYEVNLDSCTSCRARKRCACVCGEGGSGGWSDGKLTLSLGRGVQSENVFPKKPFEEKLAKVDEIMREFGGDGTFYPPVERPDFLSASPFKFDSYPLRYFGTMGIRCAFRKMVGFLESLGVSFHWRTTIASLPHRTDTGWAVGLEPAAQFDKVVIATGLFEPRQLHQWATQCHVALKTGPAGIGIRLEADNKYLRPMLDVFYDFKLSLDAPLQYHVPDRLNLRSFCVNGDGLVVNEAHPRFVTVNGRAGGSPTGRSNLAIIAKIAKGADPKAMVESWASTVWALNHGLPAEQSASEFLERSAPRLPFSGTNGNSNRGQLQFMWPEILVEAFRGYLEELEAIMPGCVLDQRSVIYAPEVKYHGYTWPLTVGYEVEGVLGLHVVGNAAGYTDSLSTAAVMGLVCGESIAQMGRKEAASA